MCRIHLAQTSKNRLFRCSQGPNNQLDTICSILAWLNKESSKSSVSVSFSLSNSHHSTSDGRQQFVKALELKPFGQSNVPRKTNYFHTWLYEWNLFDKKYFSSWSKGKQSGDDILLLEQFSHIEGESKVTYYTRHASILSRQKTCRPSYKNPAKWPKNLPDNLQKCSKNLSFIL